MTVLQTAAGVTHLAELASGGTPTNAFDGLVFGAGNDDPTTADTFDAVSQTGSLPFLQLVSGYPKLNDDDGRNGGRGPTTWTWRFEREAGAPFVASNAAVTNYAGGVPSSTEPLLVHAKQTIAQRLDERLVVFVNVPTSGDPSVVTATEEALDNRVQRVESFTARTRAVQSYPAGESLDDVSVRSRPQPEQVVWTAANLWGAEGRPLEASQVTDFTLYVEEWDAQDAQWVPAKRSRERLDPAEHVYAVEVRADTRWFADGGYNVMHIWKQPRGTTEGTFRLRYELALCDGDVRKWTNVVEVR